MNEPNPLPAPSPLDSPVIRALMVLALFCAGVAFWLHFGGIEFVYDAQLWGIVLFAVVALIPPVARPLGRLLHSVRRFSARGRVIGAMCVFAASAGTLLHLNMVWEKSDLAPSICDEYSYLIQAQLLAQGRLWSAPHEQPEFFTTFQVVASPVYGSIYFPGTALWIAPWSMLDPNGLLAWIGPWLAASLAVTIAYLVTAELLDDLAGILVAFMSFAVPIWRGLALVIMGQVIAAMLGLLVVWLFLRWRKSAGDARTGPSLGWGAAAGFVAVWAVLTRPVDGMAWSLPVILAVIASRSVPARLRAMSLAAAMLGMLPLAALQLSFNEAVTGSMLRTPFSWYNQKYLPGTSYGEDSRDAERMKQIEHTAHFHFSYQSFTREFVETKRQWSLTDLAHERLRQMCVAGTTHGMTLVWAPFALLLLLPRRGLPVSPNEDPEQPAYWIGGWQAWLMAAPFPLMWLLYLPYGFFLYQYSGAAIPSMAFCMVAGAWGLCAFIQRRAGRPTSQHQQNRLFISLLLVLALTVLQLALMSLFFGTFVIRSEVLAVIGPFAFFIAASLVWNWREGQPRPWWHYGVLVFTLGALAALGTRGIPGFYRTQSEDWYVVPELREVDRIMAGLHKPALVFISPPGADAPPEADAVYNLGVTHPDDAELIRAHDLAARNVELVAYYAAKDPDRRVYHYDRRSRAPTYLGTASELSARPASELRELFNELSLKWRRRYAALLSRWDYDAETMPFEAPPESEWDEDADRPAAAGAGPERGR